MINSCAMKQRILLIIVTSIILLPVTNSHAFWVWTPETNKWVNPKYAVKETPSEQLDYAKDFFEAEDYDAAYREFRKLIKHYPRSMEAPEAQFYVARILQEQGKPYEAFKEYQTVIEKYPFSDLAPKIVKIQYDMGVDMLEGDLKKGGVFGVLGGEYDVPEIFRAVIKNAPYGEYAAPSQYKIGLYHMERGMFVEARDEFEKVINDYPDSEWAKAARYQIALSDAKRSTDAAYDQKITESAREEFENFLKMYPDAELTDEAKSQISELKEKEAENAFMVAKYYEKSKNYRSAKIYYKKVVDEYKNSVWASKALERYQAMSLMD